MKKFKYIILSLLLAVTISACEEEANQWNVEAAHARLFKPLVFENLKSGSTDITIKYNKVVSANKYVFEFSNDSLLFADIVKRVEVLADTLTPFAESSTVTKTEFRTLFIDLDALSKYSVRMQAVDTVNGVTSNYSAFYFETASEQIIQKVDAQTDKAQIYWTQTNRVTHLTVENTTTGELVASHLLTDGEVGGATALIDGLGTGTNYMVKIYNNDKVRGAKVFKTLGIANSVVINVLPTDVVADLLAASVAEGNTSITLSFEGGQSYDLGTLTVPAGVSNLCLTGIVDENNQKPTISLPQLRFTDLMFGQLSFENIKVTGFITQHCVYISAAGSNIESVTFTGCQLDSFNSLIRVANVAVNLGSVVFNDCIVNNIGGYGVVNIGGSTPVVGSIKFQNSTLTELTTQLMDVRTAVAEIVLKNCTFCNLKNAMSQLLRFDTNRLPLVCKTENLIVAGNNGGAKINSLSYDGSTTSLNVSFAGSYRTNDLVINKYEFFDVTLFNGTTTDLFVDPANYNFTVKSSSGFAGRGTVGDPRWF